MHSLEIFSESPLSPSLASPLTSPLASELLPDLITPQNGSLSTSQKSALTRQNLNYDRYLNNIKNFSKLLENSNEDLQNLPLTPWHKFSPGGFSEFGGGNVNLEPELVELSINNNPAIAGLPQHGDFITNPQAVHQSTTPAKNRKSRLSTSQTYLQTSDSALASSLPLSQQINFSSATFSSYGTGDTKGSYQIQDGGSTLQLSGNTWKKIDLPYQITANTVLKFDFRSTSTGEIHGIGLDDDNISDNPVRTFQLSGTQGYGDQTFHNYSGSDWKSYSIDIGQSYTGSMRNLFFANDHDIANPTATSFFRNVTLCEKPPSSFNFNAATVSSYGTGDTQGSYQIQDGGSTLKLSGNTWKKVALPYQVTANTMLEFDFRSTSPGEIHGIGLDEDNLSGNAVRTFQLSGTQAYGNKTFKNYSGTDWKAYSINVGKFYTGQMNFLTFTNDHDVTNPTATSFFRNVRLYEKVSDTAAPFANLTTAENLDSTKLGTKDYRFTVTYTDNVAVNHASLNNQDLRITGPNGFNQLAALVSVNSSSNGSPLVATYSIQAPGGTWNTIDNGTYTIAVEPSQVKDTNGNAIASQTLGTFKASVFDSTGIPLWKSGFENGFPGEEWRNWDPGYYSETGEFNGFHNSNWTILDKSQAAADGVTVNEGDHIYKGWINGPDSELHRAYPLIYGDDVNPEYPNGLPSPVVNRFYAWMDWDPSSVSSSEWMHFATFGNDTRWNVTTMSAKGPQGKLELAHVGNINEFAQGKGWERLNDAYMPLREWVRFTVYIDYVTDLMYVWMDGKPIFRANGGTIDYDGPSDTADTPNLLRAHWGLYGPGSLDTGVQYNDSIQLWQLPKSLTDFSQEPLSPYDGAGW